MTAVTPATEPLAAPSPRPAGLAEVLARSSLRELGARARALAVLDPGTARELVGPFDGVESPWLEPQGLVPQADDGVVVVRGTIAGHRTVVVAVEQGFQGGAVGEVSGARISETLRLAAADGAAGRPTATVLFLETGGVRLQEANLGLAAVAEICDAVLTARRHAPVVAVVAGDVGCFGGVSIALGLCTAVVATRHARVGLNGPAVVELEAGRTEFDSADRRLVWAVHGAAQRRAQGLVDHVVPDDAAALRQLLAALVAAGPAAPGTHRSERVDVLAARLAVLDPAARPGPDDVAALWGDRYEVTPELRAAAERADTDAARPAGTSPGATGSATGAATGRGATWLRRLGGTAEPEAVTGSVLVSRTDDAVVLAVVPDPASPFPRAREGEVGLRECLALARTLHEIRAEDAAAGRRRPIVAVVDLPSQAYGLLEETAGLHAAIATAVDAYAACRADGHPVVALVVGTALSGGFLTHGLQAAAVLVLDDPGVEIHAMHRPAAARITRRSVDDLDRLAARVPPLSYDVRTWATLGLCDGLVPVTDADDPTDDDVRTVRRALADAIALAGTRGTDLSYRLDTPGALRLRTASRTVRDLLAEAWVDGADPADSIGTVDPADPAGPHAPAGSGDPVEWRGGSRP